MTWLRSTSKLVQLQLQYNQLMEQTQLLRGQLNVDLNAYNCSCQAGASVPLQRKLIQRIRQVRNTISRNDVKLNNLRNKIGMEVNRVTYCRH